MRKRKRTTRKRTASKGLSSSAHTPRRRRRRGGLSDAFSGASLKNGIIENSLGALGGAGASVGNKLITSLGVSNVFGKILVGTAVGLGASLLGAPKSGIGFSGGITALALQGGLNHYYDNAEFAEDDVLEEGEIYQDEDGNLVKMLNDGSLEYLDEDEQMQYLNDGEIYPNYSTMNAFQS